ncbi:metallophosphoesterase [Yinghuangia soli]|uniref:Metallophosphoesterase n=1 Tax=Yinghuangia soli TaxID=2908204 RepID=A0AA41TYB1_9ACTN|nr:metallophosphoesterase [Yinghuangia soli]MCF2527653.1 metallophosphoesterase [Yinghuangia soli]
MRIPRHTLVQFSDVHIVPENELLMGTLDTLAQMRHALEAVEEADMDPVALLFTGDLADTGDVRAYRRLRALVEPAAARIGAPAVYGMGNHDNREAFREGLLETDPSGIEHDFVHQAGDVRVVVLDSTTPGSHGGALTGDQLEWLRAVLAEPAPAGTVLALHHPPIPTPLAFLERLSLKAPEELGRVVAGTDVKIILTGHNHHATCGVLAGVPVWSAPAVAYRADVFPPAGTYQGVTGVGYTRVDLYEDCATATFVPVGPVERVYHYERAKVDKYLAANEH